MGFNVAGGVTGSLVEVETASLAMRVTERPTDPLTLGGYRLAADNGTTVMTAGLAANSPIYSFRWGNTNLAVLNTLRFWMTTTVAFAAGRIAVQAFFARSFSATDTGGTALTLTTHNAKKRTSFGTTLLTDARISATATLTAGTRTLDAQPFATLGAETIVASANSVFSNELLYNRETSDQYPITLAQNEGVVIQITVPATGTWFFGVTADWLEAASY